MFFGRHGGGWRLWLWKLAGADGFGVGGLSGFDSVKWSGGREAEIAAKDGNGRLDLSDYDISSLFE